MYRLKTLGGIDLRADGGPSQTDLLTQPKRVALLACLSVQAGLQVRRDTLLALLWPELQSARARHALRQTVYLLRQSLGPDVIVNRGEEDLGVDQAVLWSDVAEFNRLLDEGRAEEALDHYGGEFLPGFHLPGASQEFEDWLAAKRREYKSAAVGAALAQLQDRRREGDLPRATELARWAAAQDPINELVHLELIRLLSDGGDAAGAQRVYNTFAQRLERDLGTAPAARTREALTRAEAAPPLLRPGPTSNSAPPATSPPETVAPKPPGAQPRPWARWVIGASLPALLIIAWLTQRTGGGDAAPALAVGEIHQVTDSGDSDDRLPVSDLLATSLARLPGMQVLSAARLTEVRQALTRDGPAASAAAIARKAGAQQLLEGNVYRVGTDSLVLELRRVDLRSGRVIQGYRVGASEVFSLVDRATDEFARAARVAPPAGGIADVTTGSLVAFRLYQEGLRSFYASEVSTARRFFQSAVDEDSTFAMATWYLARTEQLLDLPSIRARYLTALRLAGRASQRERLLITADVVGRDSRRAALAVAETLAARYPIDPDGSLMLGILEAIAGDYTRSGEWLRRTIALDSAVGAHPGPACRQCEAYQTLVGLELEADSLSKAAAVAEEFVTRIPASPQAWLLRAGLAWQTGDSVGAREAEASYSRLLPGVGRSPGVSTATLAYIARGEYQRAEHDLRALDWTDDRARRDARWYLAIVLRNQGRMGEALELARGGPRLGTKWAGLGQEPDSINLLLVELEMGLPATCIAYARGALSRLDPWLRASWPGQAAREQGWALARRAMCEAAAGDTTGLGGIADSLQQLGAGSGFGRDRRLHHYVRGLLWKAQGRPDEAILAFRAAISSPTYGFTRINLELGKLLLDQGRPREAVAILAPALRGALDASNLYVTRTELHESLAGAWDAAGQRDSARAHWAAVVGAWSHADPMFQERYEAARRRLSLPPARSPGPAPPAQTPRPGR